MINPKECLEIVNSQKDSKLFNKKLFEIYEGDLNKYVCQELDNQLSQQQAALSKMRSAPINVLTKITDKQSQIYQQKPTREVLDGTDQDKELLSWYEDKTDFNSKMNYSNEFYNLFKSTLIQPYIHKGQPQIRAIPDQRFYIHSDDNIDPLNPTMVILYQGSYKKDMSRDIDIFHAYTDDHFLIFDSEENVLIDQMEAIGNPEGVNPFGKLPFIYVNKSKNLLIPKPDRDAYQMSVLLPLMLTDINYAIMFQAFSIFYTIDANAENLKLAPNMVWNFQSDPHTDKKPEIGTIKPNIDIESSLTQIQSQFSLWLNTKGIKPGSIGALNKDSFSSGISKMLDEMDTTEAREKQVTEFSKVESNLWDLILNYMHTYWSQSGLIENTAQWTTGATVQTNFAPQTPMLSRGDIVDAQQKEVEAGFTTKKRAIKTLNPHMTDSEIEKLLSEIESEREVIIYDEQENQNTSEEENAETNG